MASPTSTNPAQAHFESFLQAQLCQDVLSSFQGLCGALGVEPGGGLSQYHKVKAQLNYWSAKSLWAKLDKRASQPVYQQGRACTRTKVCLSVWGGAWRVGGVRGAPPPPTPSTPPLAMPMLPYVFPVPGGGCGTLRSAGCCGAGDAGGPSGAGGKAHQVLSPQRAPPLALHHPRPSGTRRQEVLWALLHRLPGPHQ